MFVLILSTTNVKTSIFFVTVHIFIKKETDQEKDFCRKIPIETSRQNLIVSNAWFEIHLVLDIILLSALSSTYSYFIWIQKYKLVDLF